MEMSDQQWAILQVISRSDRSTLSSITAAVAQVKLTTPPLGKLRPSVLKQMLDELISWNFVASYPAPGLREPGPRQRYRLTILGHEAVANPQAAIEL